MEIYTVQKGDSLAAIANRHKLELRDLAAANGLSDSLRLSPGLALLLPDEMPRQKRPIELWLQGEESCMQASYALDSCGSICENGAVRLSAPKGGENSFLALSNTTAEGTYSPHILHRIFSDTALSDTLTESIISAAKQGNYIGVHLNFNYLYPFQRKSYSDFLLDISRRLHREGLMLCLAAAVKEAGEMHEAQDYAVMAESADRIILLSYDWGHGSSSPQAVSPVNRIIPALERALEYIPAEKLLLGFSDYARSWSLPWAIASRSKLISNRAAINLAVSAGADINFDPAAKASWFVYTDALSARRIVWFEDIRSFRARLSLLESYPLAGIALFVTAGISPALRLCLGSGFQIK